MDNNQRILHAARLLMKSGVSVIPIKAIDPTDEDDKGKKPALKTWKEFETRIASSAEIDRWFAVPDDRGLAMIGGIVSGNLEFIDFDEPGIYERFLLAFPTDLLPVIGTMPLTKTPGGGEQLAYRCEEPVDGPLRLAFSVEHDEDGNVLFDEHGKAKVIKHSGIETRGEGSYVVCSPSPPCVHPANKPYNLVQGSLLKIPVISAETRKIILDTCRSFDQRVTASPEAVAPREATPRLDGSLKPGEDYNRHRGLIQQVFEKHGWRMVINRGAQGSEWRHPDATATTSGGFDADDGFVCFSSSVPMFEPRVGYSPFDCYTRLEYGDGSPESYRAAARDLGRQGYGAAPINPNAPAWPTGAVQAYGGTNGHHKNGSAPETGGWHIPRKLTAGPLPEFPVHVLPQACRDMIDEVTRVGAVPKDMAAMTCLQVIAAATRGRVKIQVGQVFSVHSNTFGVVVAKSSEHKSFVVENMAEPLRDLEMEVLADSLPQRRCDKVAWDNLDNRILGIRNKIRNSSKLSPTEKTILEEEILALEEKKPILYGDPQILIDDCNTTSLAAVMAAQEDNSVALISEEGGFFDMLTNGDGKSDFDFILKALNQEATRVNRITRGFIPIHKPALTVMLMVQPVIIESLVGVGALKGKGLLSRFLYSFPESAPFIPFNAFDMIDADVRSRYHAVVKRMFAITNRGTREKPREWHRLMIDPMSDAMRAFEDFSDDIQRRYKADDGDLPHISDWAGKLAGHVARIAGILHLLRYPCIGEAVCTDIDLEDMQGAIEIGQYLLPHALKVYGIIAQTEEDRSGAQMLKVIERINKPQVSVTEIDNRMTGYTQEQCIKIRTYLWKCGYLRPTPGQSGFCDVNPAILMKGK